MALAATKKTFSRLFGIEVGGVPDLPNLPPVDSPTETPFFYLQVISKCMEQADMMTSFCNSSSPKFNHEECKYLSYKLKIAVQNAHSFLKQSIPWYCTFDSPEEMVQSLEIFKLLFVLSKEVVSFIESCCKDEWIQSAIMLTNASEHITSICFSLQFCTIVLSERKNLGATPSLTLTEVASVHQVEAELVKKMANIDEVRLFEKVFDVYLGSSHSNPQQQLATFLLGRLNSSRLHPGYDLSGSFKSLSHPEVVLRSMKQMEKLGSGASGAVCKAMWLGAEVAKKTFHGPHNPDFVQEVSILAGLYHPNILDMFGYMRDEHKCHIIMELMDGDLYGLMQERLQKRLEEFGSHKPPFYIAEALDIMLQVAQGVLFLHEKNIVHRDLKSHNILVKCLTATEVNVTNVQVKVADFGLSKTKERSKTYSNQTPNVGTSRWMAPEIIKIRNYDSDAELMKAEVVLKHPFKSDVYSFGMVCYEILTGLVPFSTLNPNEVKKVILSGVHPQLPDHCPNRLRDLIEACWSLEASKRPCFGDICAKLRQMKCEHFMTSSWSPRCFSFDEIRRMTNNFNRDNFLPLKSNDKVFKGVMVDTWEVVEVERTFHRGYFKRKLKGMARFNHKNLVRLGGFCDDIMGDQMLVFEDGANTRLSVWLGDRINFKWPVRKSICFGVANGIHYLHAGTLPKVIHWDIRPDNILLDGNQEPKIGGFSWAFRHPDELTLRERRLRKINSKTIYEAPEYADISRECTEKVDVYSYGVLLLDVVSGRSHRSALQLCSEGKIKEIIDPTLDLEPNEEMEAIRMIKIAFLCVHRVAETRPDMNLVVAMLQGNRNAEISSLGLKHEKELKELM